MRLSACLGLGFRLRTTRFALLLAGRSLLLRGAARLRLLATRLDLLLARLRLVAGLALLLAGGSLLAALLRLRAYRLRAGGIALCLLALGARPLRRLATPRFHLLLARLHLLLTGVGLLGCGPLPRGRFAHCLLFGALALLYLCAILRLVANLRLALTRFGDAPLRFELLLTPRLSLLALLLKLLPVALRLQRIRALLPAIVLPAIGDRLPLALDRSLALVDFGPTLVALRVLPPRRQDRLATVETLLRFRTLCDQPVAAIVGGSRDQRRTIAAKVARAPAIEALGFGSTQRTLVAPMILGPVAPRRMVGPPPLILLAGPHPAGALLRDRLPTLCPARGIDRATIACA